MVSTGLFLALLSSVAHAATTHQVVTNGLTFAPNVIIAERGDIIEFRFGKGNHSVVGGTFSQGCAPVVQGFYSGHFPVSEGLSDEVFVVSVEDMHPTPFYCSTGNHCQSGMVGIINPSGNSNLDLYTQLAARAAANLEPPGEPFGGIIVDVADSPSSTSPPVPTSTPQATEAPSSAGVVWRPSLAALGVCLGFAALLA